MRPAQLFLVLTFTILALGVHAKVEVRQFTSPDHEERYNTLIQELRCLVCQNQNIADSNAELAQDLRRRTYRMVEDGKSEDEIVDFMVARYGDFVMYRPPVRTETILLWAGPFLILLLGVFFLLRTIRRRATRSVDVDATVDAGTLRQASSLLRDQQEKDKA